MAQLGPPFSLWKTRSWMMTYFAESSMAQLLSTWPGSLKVPSWDKWEMVVIGVEAEKKGGCLGTTVLSKDPGPFPCTPPPPGYTDLPWRPLGCSIALPGHKLHPFPVCSYIGLHSQSQTRNHAQTCLQAPQSGWLPGALGLCTHSLLLCPSASPPPPPRAHTPSGSDVAAARRPSCPPRAACLCTVSSLLPEV